MNIFFEEHILLLKSLVQHKVEFLLIGGYAVIHYGYRRTTGDLDLWIKPDNDSNKTNLVQALISLGYDVNDLEYLNTLDFTKHILFSLGDEPQKVDFITRINMVDWEAAWSEKNHVIIENYTFPIIHMNHLILSKINNNRLKDHLDVEELQKIAKGLE